MRLAVENNRVGRGAHHGLPSEAVVVAVTNGRLGYGTWERIFYGDVDGRRRKRGMVKIIGE